jgi:hypothetical protein
MRRIEVYDAKNGGLVRHALKRARKGPIILRAPYTRCALVAATIWSLRTDKFVGLQEIEWVILGDHSGGKACG